MKKSLFIGAAVLVAILQSGALASMLYSRANQLGSGREVVMESRFVDPLDLFRGHYVTINLIAGELKRGEVEIEEKASLGEVHVELEKGEGVFWIAKKLWKTFPENAEGPVLTGNLRRIPNNSRQTYLIQFPFDRYFADYDRAQALEKVRRDQKLGVVLSVQDDGTALIKGLMVDGDLIYEEPLF